MVIEIERTRSLDVTFPPEQLYGAIYGGERNAHKFIITSTRNDAEIALSGTVTARFLRADNVDVALEGTIEGGKACVTLGDECYAVPGRYKLAIFVTSGTETLCVYAAIGNSDRTAGSSTVDGGEIIESVADLIADIEAARATIPATYTNLMAGVAGTYDATKTYAVGDYVWYDGQLKRCIVPITTAESWTAAHWANAVIGDDLNVLKSAKDQYNDDGKCPVDYIWEVGAIDANGDISTSKRLRTKGYYETREELSISATADWYIIIFYYDSEYTFKTNTNWSTGENKISTDYPYYRIIMRNTNSNMDMNVAYSINVQGLYKAYNTIRIDSNTSQIADNANFIDTLDEAVANGISVVTPTWEVGAIYDGIDGTTTKRLRTRGFLKSYKNTLIKSETDWWFVVFYYNSDYSYAGEASSWTTGEYSINTNFPFYRITFRNSDSSMDMVVSYASNITVKWITQFYENVQNIEEIAKTGKVMDILTWEVGAITSGADSSTSKRLRTKGFYDIKDDAYICVDSEWYVFIFYYDSEKSYVADSGKWVNGRILLDSSYEHFRLTFRNTNSNMDMIVSYGNHVSYYYNYENAEIEKLNTLPSDYLMETINSALGKININYDKPMLSFIWITDSHLNPADQNNVRVWNETLKSMKYVDDNAPIRFLLHTGDYVDLNYATSGANNIQIFNALSKSIKDIANIEQRLIIANGNHDGEGANGFGNVQWYYAGNGSINNGYVKKNGVPNAYSYKDFVDLKIRVLTLSMPDSNQNNRYYWGFTHEQIQWILNDALHIDDGWKVIITIHAPTVAQINGERYGHVDVIEGIFTAFNNHSTYTGTYSDGVQTHTVNVDYSSYNSVSVIACFAGHTHGDLVIDSGEQSPDGVTNGLPCPIIVSGAAWFDAQGATGYTTPSRAYFTGTEILFNVVCYYPGESTIKVYRVGAGNDRTVALT